MNQKILGDKKKRRYDEGLVDVVNEKFKVDVDVTPEEVKPSDQIDLSKIRFELGINKNAFYFDESLKAMKNPDFVNTRPDRTFVVGRDYNRHPRPREIFEFLREKQKAERGTTDCLTFQEVFSSEEWTGCAFKLVDNVLRVALDPKNLFYSNFTFEYCVAGKYGLKFSSVKAFEVGYLPSKEFLPLEKFPQSLIEYLYGKEPLIYEMKRPQICLPRRGIWRPVARNKYDLNANIDMAKSRGVKIR